MIYSEMVGRDKELNKVEFQVMKVINGEGSIVNIIGEAGIGVDTKSLTTYSVPTLFVTGDLDVLFPAEYIEALAATVPGAECVNLGQVGHSSYFETPEEFNAEV